MKSAISFEGEVKERSPGVSTVERILLKIRDGIRNGAYAPGQRMVEADFTAELGVSRGPVREAFRRLAAEGLLTEEHHRGMRVRQITLDELKKIYRVREMLEGLAARMAAENVAQGGSAKQLQQIAKQLERAMEDGDMQVYFDLNASLHEEIIRLGQAPILERIMPQLNTHVFRMQFWHLLKTEHAKQSNEGHRAIVHAIVEGDPDEAERQMRAHVRASGERMLADTSGMLLRS